METSDFHVSLLNDEELQGQTELRTCLLEAMAMGMVCLHVPTQALSPDVFRDGENILFVDPRDPAAAAERIIALADSPDRWGAVADNARRTIESHFDMRTEYRKVLERFTTWPGMSAKAPPPPPAPSRG
jgi:glycosyltransferase involved in cell wall biosynthesis